MAAITSGGAIPETANYNVVAEPEGTVIGTVDEDFAIESMAGDIFLLGTTSWQIRRVEAGVVRVDNAHGSPPSIPFVERRGTRLPAEVEETLWQLVAAGLVTADGFDALRSLADRKRRLGEKGHRNRPRASSGRWTLLRSETEQFDVDAFARRLVARWGIVFRDVVARETLAPKCGASC